MGKIYLQRFDDEVLGECGGCFFEFDDIYKCAKYCPDKLEDDTDKILKQVIPTRLIKSPEQQLIDALDDIQQPSDAVMEIIRR